MYYIYIYYIYVNATALGTGIGTAALVDGRLLRGSRGLIEGGHMVGVLSVL
jgi:predicted NBD/HSP70 family sugar kinase